MKILKALLITFASLALPWAIIMLGLTFIWSPLGYVAEQAPDCENGGHIAYYKDWFGRCYLDKDGLVAIDKSEIYDLSSDIYSESWENGKTLKDKYAPLGHALTKIDEKKATCLQDGLKEHYYCEQCNARFTDAFCSKKLENGEEIIPKLGHLGNEKYLCRYLSNGEHEYFCERAECPGTMRERCSGTWSKPLDCTKVGDISRICEVCENVEIKPYNINEEHNWGEWKIEVPATCTVSGVKTRACQDCRQTDKGELSPTGHTPDAGIITTYPTCVDQGEMTYYCSVCRQQCDTRPIPPTNHHTDDAGQITKEPTCSTFGEKIFRCAVCKCFLRTERVDKLSHTPDAGKITQEATCAGRGTKTYYCTKCGEIAKTEEIPATGKHTEDNGHITKDPTCSAPGEKTYRCVVCDCYLRTESVDQLPHTPDSGTITKSPTCALEGEKTYKCSVCGIFIRKESVGKLPHTYTISDRYWNEPGYEASTKESLAKIQYSCGECHEQFVEKYDKERFIKLGIDGKIMPEDKYTADTIVMFDEEQGCLAINLILQSSDLSGLSSYSNIFDFSTRVMTIPAAYGNKNTPLTNVRIIGPLEVLNDFMITTKSFNILTLTLKNISYTSKNGVGLDLSNVANANLEIIGAVTINGAAEKDGVVAQNLSIYGDNSLTIKGGNGNKGTSSAGGNGGNGVKANYVSLYMTGNIVITGGNGGNSSTGNTKGSDGENGGNGGSGIKCSGNIQIEVTGDLMVSGGNGGNGSDGVAGNNGDSSGGYDVAGANGQNGGSGGDGGDGAQGIICSNLTILNGDIIVYHGNGGNGGNGKDGGNGGAGHDGVLGLKNDNGYHEGSRGGNGGQGGNGGNGGSAICQKIIEKTADIKNSATLTEFVGSYGNGGNGGKGGSGGKGGNGGRNDGRPYIDTPRGNDGGNGGNAGAGGNGGNGKSAGKGGEAGSAGEGGAKGSDVKFGFFQQYTHNATPGDPGQPANPGKDGEQIK